MSRHFGLLAALLAAPVFAQELLPPSPVDLVRGLREGGMADLGLEYLADLAKVASPEVAKVLPLERAKCRLDMARTESDDTLRAALVSEAKREFDAFVKGNSGHPRLPEAAVALAQLQTLEGKGQLQRAARLPTEQQAGEMAKARPLFESAGKQYAAAAEVLKKLADQEEPNSAKGREYATNYLQALLDQGMNTFFLAESYGEEPRGKDTDSKVKAAKDAAFVFDALWSRSKDTPQGWAARAWSAESFREQFEPNKADAALKVVVDEAAKARTPASAAGAKVARFFQLRADYVKNGHAQAASADRLRVRSTCQGWLREFATPPTAEVYAVRYYLGRVCLNEGLKRENLNVEQVKPKDPKEKPEEKVVGVKDSGVQMLREADAQFKILVRTENEYTDRATRQRPLALRWLVGNPNRPPAQFPTFDDCYTAALVQ
nr:hypothetical protein [Fimbriiglobus sp.]